VLVVKFPALHPGDVRKFTAVKTRALHDMVDCLVFPKTHSDDDRPHTSQLSGQSSLLSLLRCVHNAAALMLMLSPYAVDQERTLMEISSSYAGTRR
jgi:hypothetical protein